MLEYRQGNISKARTLFDAATFARKTYAAAWHAWAQMEESVGNLEKVFWKVEWVFFPLEDFPLFTC